jgi:hypothetical protein
MVLELVAALVALLVVVPLWIGAIAVRAVWRSLTWLTEAHTRISELEREKLGKLSRMSEGTAPDALVTRLAVLETGLESQKMLVSDAVERVTALGNRVAARQRRAAEQVLEDDEPDNGPTPEQARALAALLGKGNGAQAPITAPAAPASGLSLKERAKLHRAQQRG